MIELLLAVNAGSLVRLYEESDSLPMHNRSYERRKESRIQVRFPAALSWADTTGKEITEQAHTFSISNTGAGLIAKRLIAVGEKVKVTIDVGGPSGSSLAEIKWVLPVGNLFKVGLSFQP